MIDRFKEAWEAASKLAPDQAEAYKTWIVVEGIRDLVYYLIVALVIVAIARRLINATMAAMRENRRERA